MKVDKIAAIDPGTSQSALIVIELNTLKLDFITIDSNESIIRHLRLTESHCPQYLTGSKCPEFDVLLIEKVASYGMAVGKEVFETCFWIGRFMEAWHPNKSILITRNAIKNTLCHSSKAKDANVLQAVKDIMSAHFSIDENKLKGTKKNNGPLYGMKSHMWSALALALAWIIENNPSYKNPDLNCRSRNIDN